MLKTFLYACSSELTDFRTGPHSTDRHFSTIEFSVFEITKKKNTAAVKSKVDLYGLRGPFGGGGRTQPALSRLVIVFITRNYYDCKFLFLYLERKPTHTVRSTRKPEAPPIFRLPYTRDSQRIYLAEYHLAFLRSTRSLNDKHSKSKLESAKKNEL